MSRLVSAGALILDQPDFYFPTGSIQRAQGIVPSNLSMQLFVNNQAIAWPLVDGTNVPDQNVSAGSVYFSALPTPGYYSLRMFFDRVGYWRLVLVHAGLGQQVIKEYDVVPAGAFKPSAGGGLSASFTG